MQFHNLNRVFFILFLACSGSALKAQVSHSIGLGFSGLRIWELNPSQLIIQDHDYSVSPGLIYQLEIDDRSWLLRAEIGWIRRFSDSEVLNESTGRTEFRNDISHLIGLNLGFGGSLYKSRFSSLQLFGGLMVSQDYYSTRDFRSVRGSSVISAQRGDAGLRPLKVDLIGSLSYQHQLTNILKSSAGRNLCLIVALDFIYITERQKIEEGIDNTHPSLSSGIKVGVLYKLSSSKRGLF